MQRSQDGDICSETLLEAQISNWARDWWLLGTTDLEPFQQASKQLCILESSCRSVRLGRFVSCNRVRTAYTPPPFTQATNTLNGLEHVACICASSVSTHPQNALIRLDGGCHPVAEAFAGALHGSILH
jgi:hypothetical protein|uniref:Uncharacterized protein n=1 Tax=Eutreptiella gymnastica TaxID=73025 RepID=A0A7S4FTZ2_9EUGL|mmetsp:Transcript_64163/g.106087  ORF Transcript_64163/g.106087 Transcript_64163/m.106087 type:complete len:128 (-) Transcript_64163:402-785(-)